MTTQTSNQQSSAVGALVLAGIGFFVPGIGIILAIIALVMISKVTAPEQSGLKTATKIIAWFTLIGHLLVILFFAMNVMVV
ncbi:hypothetical protein [Alkalicoccobacillus murimartini]|uniref:Flagellar motor component MotA n=1 Tax=Alkalicoccobacillus murimartini TaxID=171685 RepID=A0ABT9YH66_9BACI|nr:hypothetical protein [Alkalicoccobacillus murimartini]MDQ0207182.1 flagellar motor component MotA [Alkalicoccobacillus murimartini]